MAARRWADASADLDEARELDPNLTFTKDVEGLFFDGTQQPERARAAFDAAVKAGSMNYFSYYRAATLLPGTSDTLSTREQLVKRSVELNGSYLPALALSAAVETSLGKRDEALRSATRAAALAPADFAAQMTLARVLSGAGANPADALLQTRYALALATSDGEKRIARDRLQEIAVDAAASLPPLPPPLPLPEDALRVGGSVAGPVKIKDAAPVYPELAKTALIQGPVILELLTGVDGRVVQARALRGLPLIDRAAIDAAEKWEYSPMVINGRRVPVVMTVTMNFALEGQSAIPAPAPTPSPSSGAIRVGGAVRPPVKTKDVRPVYPPEAQSARTQGVVILEATIGIDGKVKEASVVRSIPLLDSAARAAVLQWEYTTTVLEGKPVPVIMTVTVNFTLQ